MNIFLPFSSRCVINNVHVCFSSSFQEQIKLKLSENDKKIAEYDVHLRKKDERCAIVETELRQRVQGEFFSPLLSAVVAGTREAASSETQNKKRKEVKMFRCVHKINFIDDVSIVLLFLLLRERPKMCSA